jgi:hypothetical protein
VKLGGMKNSFENRLTSAIIDLGGSYSCRSPRGQNRLQNGSEPPFDILVHIGGAEVAGKRRQYLAIEYEFIDANLGKFTANAWKVWTVLKRYEGIKTHECWPSELMIGQTTGLSRNAVRKALQDLIHIKAIAPCRTIPGSHGGKVKVWRFLC